MTANVPSSVLTALLGRRDASVPQMPLPSALPRVPTPMQQVADAEAMKQSFERTINVMRQAGQGSAEWNARAPHVNAMSQKIFNLTGEVYSQGQWVKVK